MIDTKAIARHTLVALALPTTVAGFFLGIAGPAAADTPFGTPGQVGRMAGDGYLDWILPAGVTSHHVHLVGGSGADGGSGAGSPGGRGGFGGIVDETVAVKPGQAVILERREARRRDRWSAPDLRRRRGRRRGRWPVLRGRSEHVLSHQDGVR